MVDAFFFPPGARRPPPVPRTPGARGWASRAALASASALLWAAGCLEAQKPKAEPPAPAPAVDPHFGAPRVATETEYRNALAQYRVARGGWPQPYTVAPKAPPRNEYPEFDDRLHGSPPPARLLPPLPYETADPHAGADWRLPKPGADDPAYEPRFDGEGPERARLKVLEQLVYGGDHPELTPPEPYRLQPRDVIRLDVRGLPELSAELTVASDGTIRLPTTGDFVTVRGLTVEQAAEKTREALSPYVKEKPDLRLTPLTTRGGYYYVFGEVRHPGRYPMGVEPVRASHAVLAANWEARAAPGDARRDELGPAFPAAVPTGRFVPPEDADLSRVQVFTPHRSRPARSVHDLEKALFQGATGDDPYLRSGQLMFVPSRDPARNPVWTRLP